MRSCVVLVILVACGKASPAPVPTAGSVPPVPAPSGWTCDPMPFAVSTPVPEASGAAWMTIDGTLGLVVVSDSGNDGAYAIVDPETGTTREQGKLPLGDASDDIEGLAARDDKLYGLTSAGWMRVWKRNGVAFDLVQGPYPIGPVDLPLKGNHGGDRPPAGDGMVCPAHGGNCGRNYEGLCLAPAPRPGDGLNPLLCTGFAAAKADGHLYCLTDGNDRHELEVHRDKDERGPDGAAIAAHRALAIDRPGVVADCTFDDRGQLWAADNLFGMSQVYRVDGWVDPARAEVVPVAAIGTGFSEVIAVRGDVIYRMSDTGGAPSLMAKFRCRPAPK